MINLWEYELAQDVDDFEYIQEDEFDEFCFGLPHDVYLELIGKDNE